MGRSDFSKLETGVESLVPIGFSESALTTRHSRWILEDAIVISQLSASGLRPDTKIGLTASRIENDQVEFAPNCYVKSDCMNSLGRFSILVNVMFKLQCFLQVSLPLSV